MTEQNKQRFYKALANSSLGPDTYSDEIPPAEWEKNRTAYNPDPWDQAKCLNYLIEVLQSQSAELIEAASVTEIPRLLSAMLKTRNLNLEIVTGSNPLFENPDWQQAIIESPITLQSFNSAKIADIQVAMTTANAAAAETGTLLITSGVENPTILNFIPPLHIVLLDQADICQTYEQAFADCQIKLESQGQCFPPRTINMISGPSRTADIEQTLTLGAHGPTELIVIIYQ